MTLAAGTKLGPYEILAPLGAGGMGEVYRAKDPRLGREVAIKVLPASFSADAEGSEDLVRAELGSGRQRHASSSITIASPPVPPLVVRAEVVDSDHHDFLPGGLHLREALRIAGAHGVEQAVQPQIV